MVHVWPTETAPWQPTEWISITDCGVLWSIISLTDHIYGNQSPQKGAESPNFRPMLWPNGWMDKDATWYDGRPRPRNIDADPTPPAFGHTPPKKRLAHVCCGQNGWMDQGATWCEGIPWPRPHCVTLLHPPPKRDTASPIFRPRLLCRNSRPSQLLLSTCSVYAASKNLAILHQ